MNFEIKKIPANGVDGLYADDVLVATVSNFLDKEYTLHLFANFKEESPHEIDNEANEFAINAINTFLNDKVLLWTNNGWCTKTQWWKTWSYTNKA